MLHATQRKCSEQRGELQAVKAKLTVAMTGINTIESSKSTSKRKSIYVEDSVKLQLIAKKFAVVESPWLNPDLFDEPNDSGVEPCSAARFVDDSSYDLRTVTALYNHVPVKHHHEMAENKDFRA